MKTVKGIYTFKDTLTPITFGSQDVKFRTMGRDDTYVRMKDAISMFGRSNIALTFVYHQYNVAQGDLYPEETVYFYPNDMDLPTGWQAETAKTIDFGETEQEVSDDFYAWLMENVVIENTQINITENGTTTLATAGKYCDRNINVNVEVAGSVVNDADTILDGSFSGAYYGDKITSLKKYGFCDCQNISAVSLPNCTSVGAFAFSKCAILESIDLPICTAFSGANTVEYAYKLKTITIPNLTTIGGSRTFMSCESLEEVNAPNLTSITESTRMFAGCYKLKKIAFPKLGGTKISGNAFFSCSILMTLILGGNELNPLDNVNAFDGTPIKNGKGYIYVPDNLVDTYKTATNWSVYADQIKPMSELEE